jgi:hypothetical protein
MLADKLGQLLMRSNLGLARAVESVLLRGAAEGPVRMPLIAVCGAPRTGSTLVYQIISQAFRVFLISNLQNVLYRTPLLGYVVAAWLTRPYVSDYKSAGGFVAGLNGPAEAAQFWRYWCDHQLTETTPRPGPKRATRFARVMNAVYARVGCPFLAGYLPHAFYVEHIRSVFPNCLFVRMDREMLDAAVSALRRWRVTAPKRPTPRFFFGTRPREVLPEMSPHEYVARQQYFVAKRMDAYEERYPESFLHANYSTVCADPRGFVASSAGALAARGITVQRRTDTQIPESFHESTYDRDQSDDTRQIAAQLDRLHAEFGPTGGVYRNA